MNLDVAVCLPREAPTVTIIRGVVTNALGLIGVSQDCIDDIRLALSEACNNVIEHAASDDEYEVRVQVDGHRCVVTVTDAGDGIDAGVLEAAMPDELSPRGRGIAIMRALMDRVQFRAEQGTGTVVRLTKTLVLTEASPLARN